MKSLLSLALLGTMTFSIAHFSAVSQRKPNIKLSQQTFIRVNAPKAPGSVLKASSLRGKNTADATDRFTNIDNDTLPIKTKYTDIVYGSLDINYQVMDIYLPNKSKGPFPVIVYVHGGGFRSHSGSPSVNGHIISMAKSDGFAVACVNYRGSGQAKFPAAVNDCKAAVRFLRAHAAEYRLNPKKNRRLG